MKLPNLYESKHYKFLAAITILLLVAALGLIFFKGIPSAIELKGGVLVTLQANKPIDAKALETALFKYGEVNVRQFSGALNGIEVELENDATLTKAEGKLKEVLLLDRKLFDLELNVTNLQAANSETPSEITSSKLEEQSKLLEEATNKLRVELTAFFNLVNYQKSLKEDLHLSVKDASLEFTSVQENYRAQVLSDISKVVSVESYSFRQVGPSLSQFFLGKTREILAFSFIAAAIAILIIFRALVPSFAVIFGAASDLIITLGAMSLFEIPLSLASLAGLLMLIGFSLDTDVMLTMRVLRQGKGTPTQKCHDAFRTGLLMNISTIAAFGMLALVGVYLSISTYYQLGLVAVIGAVADFFATWGVNAALILKYSQKKQASQS